MIQWIRPHTSEAGDTGLNPGQAKIPHATAQPKNKNINKICCMQLKFYEKEDGTVRVYTKRFTSKGLGSRGASL